jgi:hypothetical protein
MAALTAIEIRFNFMNKSPMLWLSSTHKAIQPPVDYCCRFSAFS